MNHPMNTSSNPTARGPFRFSAIGALCLPTVFAFFAITIAADAQIEWQGGTASYTNAADWIGGVVPGATNNADNSNGTNNVLQINSGDPDWSLIDIGSAGQTGS